MPADDITAVEREVTQQLRGLTQTRIALPAGHPMALAAEGPTFCSLWPVAKAVLQQIKSHVSGLIGIAIGIVIKAGDTVCGGAPAPARTGGRQ